MGVGSRGSAVVCRVDGVLADARQDRTPETDPAAFFLIRIKDRQSIEIDKK